MVFGQCADPQVDVVDRAVQRFQRRLHFRVGRNLAERRHACESVCFTHCVVIGQAMITAPLDVERCQIEAALPWRTEQEVPQAIGDLVVVFLRER